jgi:hypothetical protein
MLLDGQVREELIHLRRAHLGRMPFAMEQNEESNPGDLGLLGTEAVVPSSDRGTHPVQQLGRPDRR